MKNKKIFLTGEKDVGKSTCIKEIIEECQLSTCGFQTLPFYEQTIRTGFFLHSLLDIEGNDQRFSIQHAGWNETIPNVFDTFGTDVLKQSLLHKDRVLILDEIGRLEKDEKEYLTLLHTCIDEFSNILGVLKKCEIQYIQEIKARNDIILFDFDDKSYAQIKSEILNLWR